MVRHAVPAKLIDKDHETLKYFAERNKVASLDEQRRNLAAARQILQRRKLKWEAIKAKVEEEKQSPPKPQPNSTVRGRSALEIQAEINVSQINSKFDEKKVHDVPVTTVLRGNTDKEKQIGCNVSSGDDAQGDDVSAASTYVSALSALSAHDKNKSGIRATLDTKPGLSGSTSAGAVVESITQKILATSNDLTNNRIVTEPSILPPPQANEKAAQEKLTKKGTIRDFFAPVAKNTKKAKISTSANRKSESAARDSSIKKTSDQPTVSNVLATSVDAKISTSNQRQANHNTEEKSELWDAPISNASLQSNRSATSAIPPVHEKLTVPQPDLSPELEKQLQELRELTEAKKRLTDGESENVKTSDQPTVSNVLATSVDAKISTSNQRQANHNTEEKFELWDAPISNASLQSNRSATSAIPPVHEKLTVPQPDLSPELEKQLQELRELTEAKKRLTDGESENVTAPIANTSDQPTTSIVSTASRDTSSNAIAAKLSASNQGKANQGIDEKSELWDAPISHASPQSKRSSSSILPIIPPVHEKTAIGDTEAAPEAYLSPELEQQLQELRELTAAKEKMIQKQMETIQALEALEAKNKSKQSETSHIESATPSPDLVGTPEAKKTISTKSTAAPFDEEGDVPASGKTLIDSGSYKIKSEVPTKIQEDNFDEVINDRADADEKEVSLEAEETEEQEQMQMQEQVMKEGNIEAEEALGKQNDVNRANDEPKQDSRPDESTKMVEKQLENGNEPFMDRPTVSMIDEELIRVNEELAKEKENLIEEEDVPLWKTNSNEDEAVEEDNGNEAVEDGLTMAMIEEELMRVNKELTLLDVEEQEGDRDDDKQGEERDASAHAEQIKFSELYTDKLSSFDDAVAELRSISLPSELRSISMPDTMDDEERDVVIGEDDTTIDEFTDSDDDALIDDDVDDNKAITKGDIRGFKRLCKRIKKNDCSLTELEVDCSIIDTGMAESIATLLPRNRHLKRMCVSAPDEESVDVFLALTRGISDNSSLVNLEISDMTASRETMQCLACDIASCGSIRKLYLKNCDFLDEGSLSVLLLGLQQSQLLSELHILHCDLSAVHSSDVVASSILSLALKKLSLVDTQLCKEGLEFLFQSISNSCDLKWLDLSMNEVFGTKRHLIDMCEAIQSSQVETLVLKSCALQGKPRFISSTKRMKNSKLKSIDLSGNPIGKDEIKCLVEMIKKNRAITELRIENCDIDSSHKESLDDALRYNNSAINAMGIDKDIGISIFNAAEQVSTVAEQASKAVTDAPQLIEQAKASVTENASAFSNSLFSTTFSSFTTQLIKDGPVEVQLGRLMMNED